MNNYGYTSFDFYNSVAQTSQAKPFNSDGALEYVSILERVRTEISENHSDELSLIITDASVADTLKALISKTIITNKLYSNNINNNVLVEQIFQDMAGLGLLTNYIRDPNVEEVNINSFSNIEVVYSDRTEHLKDGFVSPIAAMDIIKKMARIGGKTLDAVTPHVDSYIGEGTRISAMIPPIVPERVGVVASIRKQNKNTITRDQIIDSGAAIPKELDFLVMCLTHGVSVGISGETGSGKTTDQGFLLNQYIEKNNDWNDRIFLIEDTSEILLKEWDSRKKHPTRVIYTVTRDGEDPVTMRDLIKSALRFHPRLIVPVEVRGAEAFEAANAGITGHTVLTSIHAPDAVIAYHRLLMMCTMANSELKEETLLKHCIEAWPIMVQKKQLRDGSRKYMQVFEATKVENGQVCGNMLFQYIVEREELDEDGNIVKIHGRHKRVGYISKSLYTRLRQEGISSEQLISLFPEVAEYETKEG